MTANLDENPSSCEHQLDSMIQGTSGETEKKEGKPIEIEEVKEWKIKKILNKRKIRGVNKYLVRWKGFTAEHDIWKKRETLGNTREALEEFKGRMNAEVRRQEKLDMVEEKDFKKGSYQGSLQQRCYMDGMMESLKKNI